MTVIWALWGYSLAFGGESRPWIGNCDYLFMQGRRSRSRKKAGRHSIPSMGLRRFRVLTHMLFQGMFFIITPALICALLPSG